MTDIKRVAIHVRVSTQDQSVDLQVKELTTYANARGWTIFKIYEDKATGTTGNRPQLKQLMLDAKARKFDLVLCWKLDRFFRSLKELVTALSEFSDLGIQFVSLKDNIDLTTSGGILLMHLLGAFAEFEANLIRERVRAGVAHSKAKGVKWGRPKEIDPDKVFRLRQQGMSLNEIAKTLGISKSGVHKTLSEKLVTK